MTGTLEEAAAGDRRRVPRRSRSAAPTSDAAPADPLDPTELLRTASLSNRSLWLGAADGFRDAGSERSPRRLRALPDASEGRPPPPQAPDRVRLPSHASEEAIFTPVSGGGVRLDVDPEEVEAAGSAVSEDGEVLSLGGSRGLETPSGDRVDAGGVEASGTPGGGEEEAAAVQSAVVRFGLVGDSLSGWDRASKRLDRATRTGVVPVSESLFLPRITTSDQSGLLGVELAGGRRMAGSQGTVSWRAACNEAIWRDCSWATSIQEYRS